MSQGEVEEKNFDKGPVLFVIKVAYEEDLKFFDFLKNLADLENDENSHVDDGTIRAVNELINEKNDND